MKKIDALIDNTYKTVDDRAIIYLYLINSILKDRDFKPYFYVELNKDKVEDEDIEIIKDFLLKNDLLKFVENIEVVKKIIFKKEKEIIKITATHPQKVPKLREIKKCPIVKEIYEHDIPFAKRYLIDNEIIPMTYWDFEHKKPVSIEIPKLKAVAFDMEVYNRDTEPNPERDPILMASFWDENGGKVITYKQFNHPNIEVVKNEKELIKRIIETLRQYDIIYTYNGDNFDFPYLKARAKLYGIDINLGRDGEELKIKRGGMEYRSYIPGRVHIDLYPISRRLLKLTKYTLEDVVYNLFGIEKLKIPHTKIVEYWANNDEILIEYSLQDAKYTYKIGNYFFPLEVMFSRIVNQTLFEITRMTSGQMVEYLLMKNAFKENMIVPNKPDEEEYRRRVSTTYEGGYVKEPEKGMFEDIISMDFRSLYPSIIISYNISPDTLDCECCKDISEKILGHWFCKKREGLIPKTLRNLIERRINIKRRMKEMVKNGEINEEYNLLDYEQKSLKILANSVLPDEYLTVIEDDGVKVVKIGDYIDDLMRKHKDRIKYDGLSEILEVDNLKTYSFNRKTKKCSINRVKALIRHPYSGKAYKIKLRSGRTIKITEDHSLFKFEKGRPVCVRGDEIKPWDLIVVPRKLKFVNKKDITINIPKRLVNADEEELKDLTITKRKDKEFLVRLKKTLEDIENNKVKLAFRDCVSYLRDLGLVDYNIIKRINKIEVNILNREKFQNYKKYIETFVEYGSFKGKVSNIQYMKVKEFIPNLPDKEFEDCEIGAFSGKIKAIIKLDEKLAKFLGYFVSRGRLKKIKLKDETVYEVSIYKSLPEYQKEILDLFIETFGSGVIGKDKVLMRHKIVYLILKYIFKCGDKDKKHIPEELLLADENIIKSFLEGFLKAKKNSHKGTTTFMAKDEKYLNQLMLLFSLVGIPTRFTPVKNKGYKLTLNPNYPIVNDLMLDEVKEVEAFDYNGYVYDLSVEKYENFLVNNIYAHNSSISEIDNIRELYNLLDYEQKSLKILANSILPNQWMPIVEDNDIKFVKIDNYINQLMDRNKYKIKFDGNSEILEVDNLKAFSFNRQTKKCEIKRVKSLIRHKYSGKAYKIKLRSGREIEVTMGHSLFKYENGKIVEVKGEDVKVEDLIVVPKSIVAIEDDITINIPKVLAKLDDDSLILEIPKEKRNEIKKKISTIKDKSLRKFYELILKHSKYTKNGNYIIKLSKVKDIIDYIPDKEFINFKIGTRGGKRIDAIIKLDEDVAKFLGYYVSEGYARCSKNQKNGYSYEIYIANHNKDILKDMERVTTKIFGKCKVCKDRVRVMSKIAYLFVNYVVPCGIKAENKQIPEIIFKAKKSIKLAFLEGYFIGDGDIHPSKRLRLSTKSEKLAYQLMFLLNSLGISAVKIGFDSGVYRVYINEDLPFITTNRKRNKYYSNVIPKEILEHIFNKKFQNNMSIDKFKEFIKDKDINGFEWLLNGDITFDRVKEIEEFDYSGYVYDLSVEDNENFLVNNIYAHNSVYGYLAFPRARFYSRECAEVVTYLGRKYILETVKEAEKFGFKVLYVDTDGFYAIWKEKISKEELIKKAKEFVEYINSKLPGTMELEFEGYFKRGIFVTKKRYALIDENGRVTVKGLEFVRRDWSNIAKITQRKVLEALLVEGSIEKAKKIIQDVIKDLREKRIKKEDLIIYTQLTKDPKEYKTTAPHVEIAKKLMREGKRIKVGDIIGYIIVKGTKSISERAKLPEEVDIEDVDVNYYIDNQILPPVLRIMEAVGVSKNELKKEGAQLTLDKFFN